MKGIIHLTSLIVIAAAYCQGQYFPDTRIANAILDRYYKQSNAAVNSGFAYKTQAAKNRDLQAISKQLPGLRADAHYSPQHRAALEAAEHGYKQVLKTPVDTSGGQGNWSGNPQQRLQEAVKWQQQFLEDYKNLQAQIDQVRQQALQQMAKDNAYYGQKRKEGLATLNRAGSSGLDMLDALDAKEQGNSGQAKSMKQHEQLLLKAIEQEITDQLNAMGGTWNSPYALGGSTPVLMDPQALQGLLNLKEFEPLDPKDFDNSDSEPVREDYRWPKATTYIPRDAYGNYIHPNHAPWGTYTGDTICDGREGITGSGREIAIAEFNRLNSDEADHPKYAPAWHYHDDVLSSVTGIATGPSRERAIEEYEKNRAEHQAEKKSQASLDTQNTLLPTNPAPAVTLDLPPKSVRTAPHVTPWAPEKIDEKKGSSTQLPKPETDWGLDNAAKRASEWWENLKNKPQQIQKQAEEAFNEIVSPFKTIKNALNKLSSPNQ